MKQVACMFYRNGAVEVEITDSMLGELTEIVYAWMTEAGGYVRVGSSKGPVRKRLLRYPDDIHKGLKGITKNPSLAEAEKWKQLLEEGRLIAFVHQPPPIETIVGPLRPYLDIERVLIASEKPCLNRGFP